MEEFLKVTCPSPSPSFPITSVTPPPSVPPKYLPRPCSCVSFDRGLMDKLLILRGVPQHMEVHLVPWSLWRGTSCARSIKCKLRGLNHFVSLRRHVGNITCIWGLLWRNWYLKMIVGVGINGEPGQRPCTSLKYPFAAVNSSNPLRLILGLFFLQVLMVGCMLGLGCIIMNWSRRLGSKIMSSLMFRGRGIGLSIWGMGGRDGSWRKGIWLGIWMSLRRLILESVAMTKRKRL
jgi:hypothetical protein